jgi:hypothetical protein
MPTNRHIMSAESMQLRDRIAIQKLPSVGQDSVNGIQWFAGPSAHLRIRYSIPSFLIRYRNARNDMPNNLAAAVLL